MLLETFSGTDFPIAKTPGLYPEFDSVFKGFRLPTACFEQACFFKCISRPAYDKADCSEKASFGFLIFKAFAK